MPVRLLFQDEARFGRISDRRRCWAPSPSRPVVARQVVREFLYAFVAVCPLDGQMASLTLPWVDAQTMSLFLAHTARCFSHEYCIVFLDRAGWHIAQELQRPQNLHLEYLPAWSPELNPVEPLWRYLREHYLGHHVFPDLPSVEARVCEGLQALHQNPMRVRSITNFSWLNTLCMT